MYISKKGLKYYEKIEDHKVNCHLIVKLFLLRNSLNEMFPVSKYQNIGHIVEELERNIYVNDFYYKVYENGKNQYDF